MQEDGEEQGRHEFFVSVDEEQVRREKAKARELRQSQWWKRKRSRGVCHYCGRAFRPAELTMDHLVPLARGGRTTQGNVVPACKDCNSRKKYLLPMEWEEYLLAIKAEGR
jgi:5-methylcytosine-specific restriction endonuclease McrA